jgi:hypothetical protein
MADDGIGERHHMSADDKEYRQTLVDALGELAWTLDAQGRKADSLTCTKAAIHIAGSAPSATPRITETEARKFVDEWLWTERRQTSGMPWGSQYITDTAKIVADFANKRAAVCEVGTTNNAAPGSGGQSPSRTDSQESPAGEPAAAAPSSIGATALLDLADRAILYLTAHHQSGPDYAKGFEIAREYMARRNASVDDGANNE